MKTKEEIAKIDPKFKEELENITKERLVRGDRVIRGTRRLTKAITKWSRWNELKQALIEADMEDDRFK